MRKKIFGFTFLFSIIMLGVSYYFNNNVQEEIYNLESDSICMSSTEANELVSYNVNHHFPKLEGGYDTEVKSSEGTVGDTVTASANLVVGFSFDSTNEKNVLSGTLEKDKTLELHVYYVRKSFNVSLKNSTRDYGSLVYENGESVPSSVTVLFGQSIYLDGDVLVVGDSKIGRAHV